MARGPLFVITLAVGLAPRSAVAQPQRRQPDYLVKAEFIERFTAFVEWPVAALPAGAPFVVCISGDGQLRPALERVVSRRAIKERPARVRRVDGEQPLAGCHLLYISPSRGPALDALLERTAGRPILTVADSPGWCARGVIINLFVDDTAYVRFEVNSQSAERAGLKMSAKLLRLARVIHGGP